MTQGGPGDWRDRWAFAWTSAPEPPVSCPEPAQTVHLSWMYFLLLVSWTQIWNKAASLA